MARFGPRQATLAETVPDGHHPLDGRLLIVAREALSVPSSDETEAAIDASFLGQRNELAQASLG
jgi:hypothetical protein